MTWIIEYSVRAEKDLKKLDKNAQKHILKYISERLTTFPLNYGENLKENLHGLRRYRVGGYRVICEIQEEKITILVVKIGHRKNIYK